MRHAIASLVWVICLVYSPLHAQNAKLRQEVEQTMMKATTFMVEKAAVNGGYVWYYLPDFSRRWGEMEAYPTMIWLQHPGTTSMGHLFLDLYQATGNEYYYRAAQKAAAAIIWGQSPEGGWNYMIDFAGDRSLRNWYGTIGKNGWRLEEFQHYYGNATFDDDVTSDAARFLLRIYLTKMDPAYKPALDKAIGFILNSQYPAGGWPQRFPLKYDFNKQGHPDYTSFYTFNDDVIWENIHFLMQCYEVLGEARFLDPIRRGMEFYLLSQDACGAWGYQMNMAMETAGARTYEPTAFMPAPTCTNAFLLLKFYQFTGDKKFLQAVPKSIAWLEQTQLPANEIDGSRTHPTFVEIGTNRPLYVHRKGSNVKYGTYYTDYNSQHLLSHYNGKREVRLHELKAEYQRLASLPEESVTEGSPLKPGRYAGIGTPQQEIDLTKDHFDMVPKEETVRMLLGDLDPEGRWLVKHGSFSHPYAGDGQKQEATDQFCSTNVGDETDTSPFRDPSDQLYLSTGDYLRNMHLLLNYWKQLAGSPTSSIHAKPSGK
ncbi:MAG: pectate lyase [Marinilabiliales bacterium]|nr:pectate lyase [Marinilabiliales bacterium]